MSADHTCECARQSSHSSKQGIGDISIGQGSSMYRIPLSTSKIKDRMLLLIVAVLLQACTAEYLRM